MDCIGKGEWWESVLVTLANWDGSEKALKQEVNLPGSAATDKDKTLGYLFNRALNYIVYHQAEFYEQSGFGLKGFEQSKLLQSAHDKKSQNHFEIVTADNQPAAVIKNSTVVAGHFTKSDLLALLDENQIQGNICKVGSDDHAIRIGYDGKEWMIYNPNYDHRQLETIHKVGSKEEIVTELLDRMKTNDLKLSIASLEDQQNLDIPHFEEMLKNRKIDLIKGCGFHLLARFRPDCAKQLLASAIEQKTPELVQMIIKVILRKDAESWTGFHILARYANEAMSLLFQLAEQSKDKSLLLAIAEALDSSLFLLVRYAPTSMSQLFHLVEQTQDHQLLNLIASFLTARENGYSTGLHLLAQNAPDALKQLFQYAIKMDDQDLLTAGLKALSEKDNQSAFNIIAKWDVFPNVVEALLSSKTRLYENLQSIIQVFAIAYDKDQSRSQILIQTNNFKFILAIMEKSFRCFNAGSIN